MKQILLRTDRGPSCFKSDRCRLIVIAAAALLLSACQTVQRDTNQGQHGRLANRVQPGALPGTRLGPQRAQVFGQQTSAMSPFTARKASSSRGPVGAPVESDGSHVALASYAGPLLPGPRAWHGCGAANCAGSGNCAACAAQPPALPAAAMWPGDVRLPDEFLCNGGDRPVAARVRRDWSVDGLHAGDTIAHYDTLDGRVEVEASNDVCLYAPRFAAVRKIYGLVLHEQHQRGAGLSQPVQAIVRDDSQPVTTVVQPVQPGRQLAQTSTQIFRDKTRGTRLENLSSPGFAEADLGAFEDFLIIRRGHFENSEKARLSEHLQAALTWTHDKAVQVVIDNRMAVEDSGTIGAQSVYQYEMPPGKPRLRIVKIASHENAQVGETIDFTLRFDNVGDETIGNVTIIDNLVTRLEYVPGSQECSVEADFRTELNQSESLTLRWEVKQPLDVGEGGVIQFKCRVR